MKLRLKILSGNRISANHEVQFRHGNYVTHGYGHNRKEARDMVVKNIREHIEELNKAIVEKDEWLDSQRAAEKQASRDKDAADLASGRKTREQLWRENTAIPASMSTVDISKIPVPDE